MKVKVGTTMDSELYEQVQGTAQSRGCSISQLIEDALRDYMFRQSYYSADRVSESFGHYNVDPAVVEAILEDDPFED